MDVGELFVRIRPAPGTQAALTSEASGPVAAAGRDLSKVFLAAFAVGGIATTIKGVVTAATEHQSAFAVLAQTTKDAGASNEIYGQSIESLLEKEGRLKGFSDEQLASSFTRLVSATKDSQQAFKDLGLAEDVARARHISVEQAALAVSKAEQGSATALQRLGIVVHAVTANVDALKTAHENAVIAGAKFTEEQKQQYNQALLTAAAQDKQSTRLLDLSTIQQRFGGDAGKFASTASGQFARLQQDFHQFEVTIGTDLLPALSSAAEGVGSFFTKATEDQGVRQAFDTVGRDARTVLTDIKDVAETVGPPLLTVAKAAEAVASAVGAPAILTGIAAYKTLGIVQGALTAEQGLYQRVLAAGRGETVADTSAQGKQTAAIVANTEALSAQATTATTAETRFAEAVTISTAAIDSQTAALERLAAVFVEAGATSAASRLPLAGGTATAPVVQTAAPAVAQETAALAAEQTAAEGVATATVAAAGSQQTYTEALIAGAPANAAIVAENEALAGALTIVDAARAKTIAAQTAANAAASEGTAAVDVETAALTRLTEADTVATAAAVRLGLATQASAAYFTKAGVAATALAAEETAAADAGALASAGAFGLAAIGGPVGAAIIGVAGLAAGIVYLATRESAATQATHGLENAVRDLAQAEQALPSDRLTLAEDKLAIKRDQNALATSKLSHSSLEYQQLLLNLASDSLNLETAQQTLRDGLAKTAAAFDNEKVKAQALADAVNQASTLEPFSGRGAGRVIPQGDQSQAQRTAAAKAFADGIQKTIDSGEKLTVVQRHNLDLLEQFAQVYGHVPTNKQINLILGNRNADISLDAIRRKIEGLPAISGSAAAAAATELTNRFNAATLAGAARFSLGPTISREFSLLPAQVGPSAAAAGGTAWQIYSRNLLAEAAATGIPGLVAVTQEQLDLIAPQAGPNASAAGGTLGADLLQGFVAQVFPGFNAIITQIDTEIAAGKKAAAEKALNIQIDPLKQTIAGDQQALAQLQQQAQDTAQQGAIALTQAINQAKQNLNAIGQSIANSLFEFIDKPLQDAATRISDAQQKLSLLGAKQSLKTLGEEIILPGDQRLSSDPAKAIAQLERLQKERKSPALDAYILQFRSLALQVQGDQNAVKQSAADLVKTAAESRLANLTDLFNTHRISQATLERDVTALLEHNGLTARTARTRGAAFADTLSGELTGLHQQAGALAKGPNQPGSGLIPSIVQPIDTLNATQKSLAGIASQERQKQLDETKTHTKLLQKIHSSQVAAGFTSSLDHNPGVDTKRQGALVGVGG